MFEEDVGISFHPVEDVNGKSRYIMCEIPIIERKEFVQFYLSKGTQSWDRMSISPEPISEMMSFFKDFDELDKKVLHLRKYRLLRSLDPEKDKDLLIAFEKIKKYCKESYNELVNQTTWPTRSELMNSAVVVLTASLCIALVVFVMDFVFQSGMEVIYGLLR